MGNFVHGLEGLIAPDPQTKPSPAPTAAGKPTSGKQPDPAPVHTTVTIKNSPEGGPEPEATSATGNSFLTEDETAGNSDGL